VRRRSNGSSVQLVTLRPKGGKGRAPNPDGLSDGMSTPSLVYVILLKNYFVRGNVLVNKQILHPVAQYQWVLHHTPYLQ
jgi:hypothetical protein